MYVAARGGEQAIQNAEQLFHDLKAKFGPHDVRAVMRSMPYLIDRVMGEGALYAPELAALALLHSGGDLYEATLMLRAYRSTQPRIGFARTVTQHDMLCVRRISAAFKDIPGGQLLGPSLDYSHRILPLEQLHAQAVEAPIQTFANTTAERRQLPSVADWQRDAGLLPKLPDTLPPSVRDLPDVTREPMIIPTSREVRLQMLSRAETGGVLTLGYANMRGYGSVHPTINELRIGYADVLMDHPLSNKPFSLGQVRISQAEVVTTFKGDASKPQLALGFCATIGWNEVKCIAGSMLDMAMDLPDPHPSQTEDFVLHHTDPVEASGFCIHYKLPHYVTFGSSLEAMRDVRAQTVQRATDGFYGEAARGMPGTIAEASPDAEAPAMMSAHP